MTRHRQQGFTLIEAAVAIAVVAILSGIIVPLVVKNLRDSQVARAKNDVQVIAGAIASQIKDTGSRPRALGGPNGATGAGDAIWQTGSYAAAGLTGTNPTNMTAAAATNSFANLFSAPVLATASTLFGYAAVATAADEFQYKGPYMGNTDAAKPDPWGSRYTILGYNLNGQNNNNPIWVVCAGPDKSVLATNIAATPVSTWAMTGISADDIVVRVN